MASKKTTERGLGWHHQQAADQLKKKHKDGSPCDWCGRPMWLDPVMNWDYNPDPDAPKRGNGVLQADHSKQSRAEALRKGEKVLPPDRLLHAACNQQRGEGHNDHLAANGRVAETLAMPWPWKV
ncbi:hypothetical protein LITTLEE_5 [Mycobacterium phage LittleE]|uniref:HNH endonuclease n=2 Tax=Omegavirus TaxID=1623292 RepID=Q854Q7_BPMOM|nr:HNH endonuclease [Mycobacterium phage Omega]YP_009213222.1 HNH endonuclease [Mycobacterium phage MiaZeal]YP_009636916.1 HNH endonuclease [Mycobacterium phage LittleE]ASD50648.1 HNH endonuclease [Mycobacterium phage Porcelain]ASD53398.1 hypothetical protein PBI_LUCKY2013_5 [Mycobacterium phage Lucky2013]ASZ74081.1 HNH endonuclease [Mycobacterium phage Squint]QGJ93645.1 HNH endonuclease [Mycobacterium phage Hannaconda]AAN12651.1 hypothetical protein PBI_OMEGA_7 [Mycobacterium phage Omega]